MVNIHTQIPDCDSHNPALLNSFFSSGTSICSTVAFPMLRSSDHLVVSVSIETDSLCDHLRDVPWKGIFKFIASAAAGEFCEWVQVGINVYIPHVSIRSSLTHLHGFQLFALLP